MTDEEMFGEPDPVKDAYFDNLYASFDINAMCERYGMKKSLTMQTRNAFHYINSMIDGIADPLDLGQIYHAILQIESETIPNVPVVSIDLREVHTQILRENAVLLVINGIIKGLNEEEQNYLRRLLLILLTKDQLEPTWNTIQRIIKGPPEEITYPVRSDILVKNWERNRDILEAA